MRFGFVHRVMTDALAALGVLALVFSGQFSRGVSIAVLVGLVLALSVRESWQRAPGFRHVDTVALLSVLVVQFVRVLFDANILDVLVEFAAALQIIRLATRKGAAHDQQVIVLALLHLIAGTVLGGGLGYGICFLGVLVVAPGALVLSHLRREVEGNYRQGARDRTGLPVDVPRILRSRRVVGRPFLAVTCLLSIPIFVFTALLFVLFPRVGLSLLLMSHPHQYTQIGFSPHVDLGKVGKLRADLTPALRVEIPDLPNPPPPRIALHLRGTALDSYDGHGAWRQTDTQPPRPAESDANNVIPIEHLPDPTDRVLHVELDPIDPPVVFLPPGTTALRFRTRGQGPGDQPLPALRGPEGQLSYKPLDDRGLKYDLFVSRKTAVTFQRMAASDRPRYLELPPELSDSVRKLAQSWTVGADTPLEKARSIEKHLRTEYRYDLDIEASTTVDPLDNFLFVTKRGHCEFYSTAMAILLRTEGVPTRNVMGFIGGTYNNFGHFYTVRQGDAHSWVEVWLDDVGWTTFDPTPPGDAAPKSELSGVWAYLRDFLEATSQRWERHVVNYDFNQQVSLLQTLTNKQRVSLGEVPARVKIVGAILGVGAFWAAAILYFRRRRDKRGDPKTPTTKRSESAALATELYEQLEAAMSSHGVARLPGTPPLRHAEALEARAHPLADEILALTDVYIRARFGGEPIDDDERRRFEARVKAVRASPKALQQPAA
ncbi:MAG TPA: DUF3488 and transglutaminase-like domain-containing protein [Byssovorax sp.]